MNKTTHKHLLEMISKLCDNNAKLENSIRAGEVSLTCDECDGDGNRTEMSGNDPDSAKIVKCPYCDYGSVTYVTVKQ